MVLALMVEVWGREKVKQTVVEKIRMKNKLIKIVAKLWLYSLRYYWSRVYRFFFERKYLKGVQLPQIGSFSDIQKELKRIKYSSDSIYKLFDSISYPETVWALKKDDCDGFAILTCKLLEQIGVKSFIYTCVSENIKDSHSVCVFRDPKEIIIFDNGRLVKTKLQDFTQVKEKYFTRAVIDDLRDINFNLIEDF